MINRSPVPLSSHTRTNTLTRKMFRFRRPYGVAFTPAAVVPSGLPVVAVPVPGVLPRLVHTTFFKIPDMSNGGHVKVVRDAFGTLAADRDAITDLIARIEKAGREHTVAINAALYIAQFVQMNGVPKTEDDAEACRAYFLREVNSRTDMEDLKGDFDSVFVDVFN